MGDFKQNRGKSFNGGRGGGFGRQDGGRPDFPRKNWGGSDSRDRGPVTMHQAICDQCGKSCEVPFRPTEGKPVYCNDCFGSKKEAGDNRGNNRFSPKKFNRYPDSNKTDLRGGGSKENSDELKKQLVILNVKMDQLIKAIEALASAKLSMAEVKVKEAAKMMPVIKVKKLPKKLSKR